ncbi:MAG: hypothetical protein WDZ52_03470 [Pseudohongiellaceae bacterium]
MGYRRNIQAVLLGLCLFLQVACASTPTLSDTELQRNVETAIRSASDLPGQIRIEVVSGVVRVTGTLSCDECGGSVTPGQAGTIQQSVGAVIRAVPGVTDIEFFLDSA